MNNQTTNLRSLTAKWFECIVRYERQQEDGLTKKVTESYIFKAVSFTDAETRVVEGMESYDSGDLEVKNINPCPFREVIFSDLTTDDRWFLAKLAFITINEKTEKEKFSYESYLIQADTFDTAKAYITQVMSSSMLDYVIKSIKETKYLGVYEYRF